MVPIASSPWSSTYRQYLTGDDGSDRLKPASREWKQWYANERGKDANKPKVTPVAVHPDVRLNLSQRQTLTINNGA